MKKLILLFAVLLTFSVQNNLQAQTQMDDDQVVFTAILDMVYDITVTSGDLQTAWFQTAADYNLGLTEGTGPSFIDPGTSTVTVEATGNWDMLVDALDFDDGGGQIIPIENLGVWIENNGGAHDNGVEVTWTCIAPASTQLITSALNVPLISLRLAGPGNYGDATDNNFLLHWRMGTPEIALASGLGSMFDQMAVPDFGPGTYTTTVNLTLWTNP